jgi:hypothetical protein
MAEDQKHQRPQEADPESTPHVEAALPSQESQETVPEATHESNERVAEQPTQVSLPAEVGGHSPQTGLPTEPTDPASNPQNHAPLQIDEDVPIPCYSILRRFI